MDIVNALKRAFTRGRQKGVQPTRAEIMTDLVKRGVIYGTKYETYSWVFAAAKRIAETGAQVGFDVKDIKDNSSIPKYVELFKRPSPLVTFRELLEATLGMVTLFGRAYWIVEGLYFYVLDSRFVFIERQDPNGFVIAVYTGKGWRKYTQNEAIMFFDIYTSTRDLNAYEALRKGVGIGGKVEELNDNLLNNGGFIPAYFTTDGRLSKEQREAIRKEWERYYSGYGNAGRPPVLEGGLKLEKFGLTPSDMQFETMERLTIDKVSAVFGVPAILLNKTDKINYATAKAQLQIFWRNTLLPKLSKIEERINVFLLPLLGIKNARFMFDYSNVQALQEDELAKAQVRDIYLKNGVITINEVRQEIGKEPVPYGNYWWTPANVVPAASADKGIEVIQHKQQDAERETQKQQDAETERTRKWWRFAKITENMERRLYKEMVAEFRKQHREIKKHIQDKLKQMLGKGMTIIKLNEDDLLSDLQFNAYVDRTQQRIIPLWVSFATQGADLLQAELMLQTDYDVVNPRTIEYIREHALETSRQITQTTQQGLREHIARAIAEGVRNGESTDKIAERILTAVDNTFTIAEGRAYIIARTETIRAVNWGQYEFARNSGIALKKRWLSARDNVVRPAHAEADGQMVGLDAPFVVGGESLRFPADPSGSPANTINCRCTVEYIPVNSEVSNE